MDFSIIIPAHNEEALLPDCLDSIDAARTRAGVVTETIVVLNRCTDATERIARERDAVVTHEDARSLAAIRNAGARVARGARLVTIDADSRMSPDLLLEVSKALDDPRIVGGGVVIRPERWSAGIRATYAMLELAQWLTGLSAGAFWCRRADFLAIGGFDESLHYAEDVDFARRLRAMGRTRGQRYVRLANAHIVTSCRKFERFGDWHAFTMIRHALRLRRALRRHDPLIDEYYYDFNGSGGRRDAAERK